MSDNIIKIALAGNPNVGKSTVFNALTGMKQHTGNWAGKTVDNAEGVFTYKDKKFAITDLPGTYSLMAHSPEEAIARDYICFEKPAITIVVCDATCLERNLNLALQAMEITDNVIICLNMIDEAEKKAICIDAEKLSELLGVPVIPAAARKKKGLRELCDTIYAMAEKNNSGTLKVSYTNKIETAVKQLENVLSALKISTAPTRWTALRILCRDEELLEQIYTENHTESSARKQISDICEKLVSEGIIGENINDNIVSCIVLTAEGIYSECTSCHNCRKEKRDRKIDRILTGKYTAIPIMLIMLTAVLWITVTGANYPSSLLSDLFGKAETGLNDFFRSINMPKMLNSILTEGIFRVLAWVVAVMLPPMAIFFPLFTLLEDFGILPRIAFNLDKCFKKAGACGKQALSLCMSLGCNACGVTGTRIIDSKRERLIAILTSSFVPCNGKFPTIISIITMFFLGGYAGAAEGLGAAAGLTLVLVCGVAATFAASKLLSATLLKGEHSSFTLELPPYRVPQFGKVIVRSFLDRTLIVLGRAVIVAAPAGLLIWIMANITVNDLTLLQHCTGFLDSFGRLLGLDGVILFAFILGFPANEIVVPIIIMSYAASGSIYDISQLDVLKEMLINNGWTIKTAVCMLAFSLFHFPCSTTCITIYKETKSFKWTAVGFLLPTAIGIICCAILNMVFSIFGL